MKIVIAVFIFFTWVISSQAQGIFNQKAGQIKNLIQQIAALQVYMGYLEKGYDIAKKGLTAIGDIKNGDLIMHTDYFNSLKSINPNIKKYKKVAAIIALQADIIAIHKSSSKLIRTSQVFTADESSYIARAFSNVSDACQKTLYELITLTTGGHYTMKDDERVKRVDAIYSEMTNTYSFVKDFSGKVQTLALQKNNDRLEFDAIRAFYGIPKD